MLDSGIGRSLHSARRLVSPVFRIIRHGAAGPGGLAAVAALVAVMAIPVQPAHSDLPTRTLQVGPGQFYDSPSAAARDAGDGDTVEIAAGSYNDCAVWRADRLTLRGVGGEVRVHDRTCAGKAIWVIQGNDVTVRGITFSGARVRERNGAGIRAEGGNLNVIDSVFYDNENGILAARNPNATIIIQNSVFERNGLCEERCAHGIYVNQIARLRVENSTFRAQNEGHHIKSRAYVTEIINNVIEDGESGTASYLIDVPNGGEVEISGNRMQKGRLTSNPSAAIAIGAEGNLHSSARFVIANNTFRSDVDGHTTFVRNHTRDRVTMTNNTVDQFADVLVEQ